MNQDTLLKSKNRILGRPVKFILLNRIRCILSGKLALKFHRYYRDTIYEKNNIYAVLILYGIMKLSGTMQDIRIILSF